MTAPTLNRPVAPDAYFAMLAYDAWMWSGEWTPNPFRVARAEISQTPVAWRPIGQRTAQAHEVPRA